MGQLLYVLGLLDDRDPQWMLDAGTVRHVPAGEDLVVAGRPLVELYVLLRGELDGPSSRPCASNAPWSRSASST